MMLADYPLKATADRVFGQLAEASEFVPTGLNREFYLDLAERLTRQAVQWQDTDGGIVSPWVHEETATINARFVGALGGLIAGGHCLDLIENCALTMDLCCCEMETGQRRPGQKTIGPEFYTKELMFAYWALHGKVDDQRRQKWARQLSGFDPWQRYPSCSEMWDHNYPIYAICGEQLKSYEGLADNSTFIDAILDNQVKAFNAWGMYRDPGDPMTYDLTCRQQIALMLHWGYKGRHRAFLDEMMRRGGLTQLFYTSTTGQMPYGGRSNQYHIMEAMAAVICEIEAQRYQHSHPVYARAFKRAAHLAVQSIASWILDQNQPYAIKNRFSPNERHGDEQYNKSAYACYALLTASILGTAYRMADESIEEGVAPTDCGGYVFSIWPSFHRTFATCGPYHIELDNKGEKQRDATGLGRIHRRGIRPETGFSTSIPFEPHVHMSIDSSSEYVAIGPLIRWGVKDTPLAKWADRILSVEVRPERQTQQQVRFSVRYAGDLPGIESITEVYELTENGVSIECHAEDGCLSGFVVPLLVTDGKARSHIETTKSGFRVHYEEAIYEVMAEKSDALIITLDPTEVPNNVGIYRVGRFLGPIEGVRFHLRLTKNLIAQ